VEVKARESLDADKYNEWGMIYVAGQ